MKIKLHGAIVDAETKKWETFWGGDSDLVTFKDLDEALAAKPKDDKEIVLDINCPGGSCLEGFAIYDKLRSLEGHTIKAEIIGECSSMATIILMAASVRKSHANAHICIHKPRYEYLILDNVTEDVLMKSYNDLHDETERLKKIYLERTKMSEEQLEALMSEDRYITAEQALEYGVITEIIQPMTAIKKPNKKAMNLTRAQRVALRAVGLGDCIEKIEAMQDNAAVAMTLNTEDGSTIEIEREEGDPQVGDAAKPDGEHLMSDGTTIVITDGVITEIRPAEAAEKAEEEAMSEAEMQETIAKMTSEIEALTAENDDLKKQLNASKANEKTAEDSKVLQLVANAGGLKWLESLQSKHKPAEREVKTARKEMSTYDERVAQKKENLKNKKNG